MNRELADTLIDLLSGVTPPPDSGLVVTGAILDVPLEVRVTENQGKLVFLASVPHSRWKNGFVPETQMTHLEMVLLEEGPGGW